MRNKETTNKILMFLAVFALCFLIYGNSIKGGFVFDDTAVVDKRGDLKDIGNFFNLFVSPYHQNTPNSGLYRPLTMATYSLNYAISGASPSWFHVVNILIHALNCLLLFWLVDTLFNNKRLSYASMVLFLVHPIHTEAVASIVGRAELLSFFWSFVTIYFFIKRKNILSAVSFLLALWSKESAIMVIPVIFYIDWSNLGNNLLRTAKRMLNYAIPLVIYFIFRFVALGKYFIKDDITTAVENPLKFVSYPERIATAFKILFLYVQKLFWPVSLSADYSFNVIKVVGKIWQSPASIGGLLLFAICIWGLFYFGKKRSPLGLAAMLFLAPYILISNLILPIGTIMGERLIYFSSAGFVLLASYFFVEIEKLGVNWRRIATGIFTIFVLFLSARTVARNIDWLTNESLFKSALAESSDGLITHTSLAAIHIQKKEWDEAEKELAAAQLIYPNNSHELNLLGILADHRGDLKDAEDLYKRSIAIGSNPINTYINLANLYLKESRYDEAGQQLLKVVEFNPVDDYLARYAYIQITLNRPDVAIEIINKYHSNGVINNRDLNAALGTAYFIKKDYLKAIDYLGTAKKKGKTGTQIDQMIDISKQQLNQ